MGIEAEGIINGVTPGEALSVLVPFEQTYLLDKWGTTTVRVIIDDGRGISDRQRRTIFALCGFITDWAKAPGKSQRTQAESETLRELGLLYALEWLDGVEDAELIRRQITLHYCEMRDMAPFSLSSIDMTTAHDFIGWMIDISVQHGVPCPDSLLKYADDIGRYLYACVAYRRCAICGKKAEIHEVEKVGMGRNRQKIHHLGQLVQPLCRKHHNEQENIGQDSFNKKYLLEAIRLDEHLCNVLKWKK